MKIPTKHILSPKTMLELSTKSEPPNSMKHLIKLFTLIALLYPATALALSYNTDNLPYVDTPPNDDAALAVSVLTEQGILKGNPDGTYGWQDSLNRAVVSIFTLMESWM